MAAPKGNQFWKDRKFDGREKQFTPEQLWEEACVYFKYCDGNPWNGKDIPYTIDGLCVHLQVDENTIQRYHNAEGYEDHWAVTDHIYQIVRNQKFSGAAIGLFNSNIIARDLGLRDEKGIVHDLGEKTIEQLKSENKGLDDALSKLDED